MNFVYFVRDESGAIKIGTTTKLRERVASLQTSSSQALELVGFIQGDKALEQKLHARFASFRVRREWFVGDESFMGQVRQIIAAGGEDIAPEPKREAIDRSTPDFFTLQAAKWARSIEEEYWDDFTGEPNERRSEIAALIGVQSGLLYSLRYRPPTSIFACDYEAITEAYIACCVRKANKLRDIISAARASRIGNRQGAVRKAEALLVDLKGMAAAAELETK